MILESGGKLGLPGLDWDDIVKMKKMRMGPVVCRRNLSGSGNLDHLYTDILHTNLFSKQGQSLGASTIIINISREKAFPWAVHFLTCYYDGVESW